METNAEMIAYVNAQAAKGVGRPELLAALLAAGWEAQLAHAMLISLNVPMTSVNGATVSGPAPKAPPRSSTIISPFTGQAAETVRAYSRAAGIDPTLKLPGVFALAKRGIDTYRQRFSTLLAISVIEIAVLIAAAAAAGGLIAAAAKFAARGLAFSPFAMISFAIGVAALAALIFVWLTSWVAVALLHAIRDAAERIGVREAFRRAAPRVWSFIWIGIVTVLVYIGSLTLFAAVPAGVVFAVPAFMFANLRLGIDLSVIVGIIALFAIMILFTTWFSLVNWAFIDLDTRGTAALVVMKHMIKGRFWAVLGRLAGLTLLVALAAIVISMIAALVALPFPSADHVLISGILREVLMILALYPVMFGAMHALYAEIIDRSPSIDPVKGRGDVVSLAMLGIVAAVGLPIAAISFAPAIEARLQGVAGSLTAVTIPHLPATTGS